MTGEWDVEISGKGKKQIAKLPLRFKNIAALLIRDLANIGPALPDWPNYGPLKGKKNDLRHCHLAKNSKPTYAAIWQVCAEPAKILVRQVKTHEKTDYEKMQ
jgi:hypothetical protein